MKTLLVMAGGTGGHVIPALAVANNLRARGVNIIWMGTRQGIEHTLVPNAGFDLRLVNVKGVRGSGLIRKLTTPFVLFRAAFQAMSIILSSKANAILGMGGFVSGPGGVVGWLLRKPLVLHEQNAIAGTTNKLLAPFANRILTGFEQVKALPKGQYIGNPVKSEISSIEPPEKRLSELTMQLKILVVGGSQGALVFNDELPGLMNELQASLGKNVKLSIRHQCGKGKSAAVEQRYGEHSQSVQAQDFIDDMAWAYEWSDIVICRSGAMTVAEIAAAGAVAIFVPFPHAIDDHQFHNARTMADAGAAYCLRQDEFIRGEWLSILTELATDRSKLISVAEKARAFARPNATQAVADICMEVMNA